ncbi:MAG: YkgJ family cysteine cluster protein [Gammaproteobacteria bacterium]|nr:YkgJ family cysteine cluster protein [Gammaproteobacteria bacterium]
MSDEPEIAFPSSPITPTKLDLDNTFTFACHRGVACFNKCCQSIDIQLTPYDILRLKTHLGITAREFLFRYTVPFEMDGQGMPGLKLKTRDDTTACSFLTEEGCGVYADRPAACRYYALGVVSMRKKDSPVDEDFYFVVKEDHCLGHNEAKSQTVREYREEQAVTLYDELNREWRQLVLKKRSCGPVVGKPSDRSLQLFFLASYDLDGFREFVQSAPFQEVYVVDATLLEQLRTDDVALMQFGFRFLKQVLFGEKMLDERPDALEKRRDRRRIREAAAGLNTAEG